MKFRYEEERITKRETRKWLREHPLPHKNTRGGASSRLLHPAKMSSASRVLSSPGGSSANSMPICGQCDSVSERAERTNRVNRLE